MFASVSETCPYTDSSLSAMPYTTLDTLALIRRVAHAVLFGEFLFEQGSSVV